VGRGNAIVVWEIGFAMGLAANLPMHDSALFLFLIASSFTTHLVFLSLCLLFIFRLNLLLLFLHSLCVNTFARIEFSMWI